MPHYATAVDVEEYISKQIEVYFTPEIGRWSTFCKQEIQGHAHLVLTVSKKTHLTHLWQWEEKKMAMVS